MRCEPGWDFSYVNRVARLHHRNTMQKSTCVRHGNECLQRAKLETSSLHYRCDTLTGLGGAALTDQRKMFVKHVSMSSEHSMQGTQYYNMGSISGFCATDMFRL